MKVDGTEIIVEGAGPQAIVMIHGWPDSHRLWDRQVEAFRDRWRCVRFTLPGFAPGQPRRAVSLDEVVETIGAVVEQAGAPATLLLHDWGCFFGYQFAMRHPELVERVVGVDIGDAGSRRHLAELGLRGKLIVMAYQVWLAAAWLVGGRAGDAMARAMARAMCCPADPRSIRSQMGYAYAMRWLGAGGGFPPLRTFKPHCPMLFLYGSRKPIMFHSTAWAAGVDTRAFPTGHWIMLGQPREFNAALTAWLAQTEQPRS
jgi:pimeloyl-ACP methyl ester carboxylesterase